MIGALKHRFLNYRLSTTNGRRRSTTAALRQSKFHPIFNVSALAIALPL